MPPEPRRLLQLVSELPPRIGGVADYAYRLALDLRKECSIDSTFLLGRPGTDDGSGALPFDVVTLRDRDARLLAEALDRVAGDSGPVLVHYVGYGYDRNGAPGWLIDGLERWRLGKPERMLATMFHELYAVAWPWRRVFWHSYSQKHLAQRLAQLSDYCACSRESSASTIRRWISRPGDAPEVGVMAIPSSVGEPVATPSIAERAPQIVVFGSAPSRGLAYRRAGPTLWRTCKMLGLTDIMDIGPGEFVPEDLPKSVRFHRLGVLEPQSVSEILLRSRAGYVYYSPGELEKSTIYAAYCAHALVPVVAPRDRTSASDLVAGTHYWNPGLGAVDGGQLQSIAKAVHAWYADHSQEKHALMFARALGFETSASSADCE